MPLIPFFAYSAADGSLISGLTPTFLFYKRLNSDGTVTTLTDPIVVPKGGGLYEFSIRDSDLVPDSTINYVLDLGALALPRTEESHIFTDRLGNVQGSTSSGYIDEGIDSRPEVMRGATADSIIYRAKANGSPQVIDASSAFVTVLDPGGATKVARSQTGVVISGGNITLTQAWDLNTYQLWEDYVLVWEWTVGSIPFSDRQFFDVVRNKLSCLIDESDILEIYPDAEDHLLSVGVPDASRFIKRAWSKLLDRIRSGKNRPSLILDRTRLINPAIELATAFMCRTLSKESGDLWSDRMKSHFVEFNAEMASLGDLKYDVDEDGLASNGETKRMNRRQFSV